MAIVFFEVRRVLRADGRIDAMWRDVTDPEQPGPWQLVATEARWCPS